MNAPSIYIVIRTDGDGYGHNTYDYVAWFFDKNEAEQYAHSLALKETVVHSMFWHDVQEVPAPQPIKKDWSW